MIQYTTGYLRPLVSRTYHAGSFFHLIIGTIWLRPYVFLFLLVYLLAATTDWGWRRAGLFTLVAWTVAFAAEFASTRIGVPFGLYHYVEATRGQELWIANVPLMDSLSFVFLAYASYATARLLLAPETLGMVEDGGLLPAAARRPAVLGLAVALFVLIDVIIDPVALRGDRWFLGRIYFYPDGGTYFGVPLSNFVGWGVVGYTILVLFTRMEGMVGGARPSWAANFPMCRWLGAGLYGGVLCFMVMVSWMIEERGLFLVNACLTAVFAAGVVLRVAGHPYRAAAQRASPGNVGGFNTERESRRVPSLRG